MAGKDGDVGGNRYQSKKVEKQKVLDVVFFKNAQVLKEFFSYINVFLVL